jgi:alkylation response protein AidB-like acyl-CoA dehydrogenase
MSPDTSSSSPAFRSAIRPGQSDSDRIPPDCAGLNFFDIDHQFQSLLPLYLTQAELDHFSPHLERMGEVAGGQLNQLAMVADKNGPVLHPRDRFGRDIDWIEYHPAYREMEKICWGDFQMAAMAHRPGALGWPEITSPPVKYAFQYMFSQSEFGLLCPLSVSETSAYHFEWNDNPKLKEMFWEGLTSLDFDKRLTGTQFMTEKAAGSDVGEATLMAVPDGEHWRLYGEKWFCSHADADVALLLARVQGAPAGTKGLGLFAMPRRLEDGSRNSYRIVRLKDKLGTKSMASGEIIFDGALAYAVGDVENGIKQMLRQVNLSRLSHGVRAAGMMRRCLNEALAAARFRRQFGEPVVCKPLMREQLLDILIPTEQALTAFFYAASAMRRANNDDEAGTKALRIATPLLKMMACRDNVPVATASMETRGGLGYIEEWVNARLIRDAQIGLLWEGTTNMNAIDVVMRAVGKEHAEQALREDIIQWLDAAGGCPGQFKSRLLQTLDRAIEFARSVASDPANEHHCRRAAAGLYNAHTAALMAAEGSVLGSSGGDARRLLIARLVLDRRLNSADPFTLERGQFEAEATSVLLEDAPISLEIAQELLSL